MISRSGCRSALLVLGILVAPWLFVLVYLPPSLHASEQASSDKPFGSSLDRLPHQIRTMMNDERNRLNAQRSGVDPDRTLGPPRIITTADVDSDRKEEIPEDLFVARMDPATGDQIVYIIIFWNDRMRLPGRVIQTNTWKVASYSGSLQVMDVNRDGVVDYMGPLQLVPSTSAHPHTKFFRRTLVSSRSEQGAFRPAHLLGDAAHLSGDVPTIEDFLED